MFFSSCNTKLVADYSIHNFMIGYKTKNKFLHVSDMNLATD